jgi:hypothetical protein
LLRGIVPQLLVPLAVGAALRQAWPRPARALARVTQVLFTVCLAAAALGALAISWREITRVGPWAWLAMLLVTLGAAALGDLVGGSDPRDRATAAYAVVLGNPGPGDPRGERELPAAQGGPAHRGVRDLALGLRPAVCARFTAAPRVASSLTPAGLAALLASGRDHR